MVQVTRRTLLVSAGLSPLAAAVTPLTAPALPAVRRRPAAGTRLTNLGHLDALCTTTVLRPVSGHTSYRIDSEPQFTTLWVYADRRDDGSYQPVGGGTHDTTANTWGQGAYDADDIARAAVVYLRHWQLFGEASSRRKAYEQLRTMAYFQTLDGEHAGEFVLWMQPDGTLNPTPTPADSPNPADSSDSYWTARCIWALGEGHRAFRRVDAAFAAFLAERMELAVAALRRDVEGFGTWRTLHGVRVPAWFIVNGADATSEAVLGLAAYVRSSGSPAARDLLATFARAIAAFHGGDTRCWPYRALMPWAKSLDDWHAWGAEMAAALAAAALALQDASLLVPAIGDTAGFTAHLLTSTGPVNGLMPLPTERVQIAYGADCRVRGCREVARASGNRGLSDLAGIAAGWFFGANTAGVAVYDPATGVTFDGVEADGRVNRNSGAESTIHGLLTMLVLDEDPALAALARASARVDVRDGLTVLEAEDATLAGGAVAQKPASSWTGESSWSGQQVAAPAGSSLTWKLPDLPGDLLVQPVVQLTPGSAARTSVRADGRLLGVVDHAAVGPQGDAPWASRLTPVCLPHDAREGAAVLTASVTGGTAMLDAVMVMPEVATLSAHGEGAVVLLTSKARHLERRRVQPGGTGPVRSRSYDARGRLVGTGSGRTVSVLPGGFTVVTQGVATRS